MHPWSITFANDANPRASGFGERRGHAESAKKISGIALESHYTSRWTRSDAWKSNSHSTAVVWRGLESVRIVALAPCQARKHQ
jgi:hypothetical protein